ncbi:hypothetical protein GQ55_1G067200 [Panicum hallii var. hallii]|uniref:Uncharacterized protein n=1 Tax=Panicum hallii var. hallii TaxID=1504633 RepID=A0A2T7F2Z5_9POAL|nr:hypothetical protein GQ55_1G067200 [Panicum hallii var. hallii]
MRLARIAMAMEDGGGASSSVAQPATDYGRHFQPPPFWSTPTPYLFIGFAVVMALIAVALAVLLCTRRKEDEGRRGDEEEVVAVRVLAPLDREDAAVPKVLVVMAGHSAPSFLASAAPFATFAAAGDDAKPQHGGGGGGKDGGCGGGKDGAAVV